MILIAGMMACRTYCDVWMIQNGTYIERFVLSRRSLAHCRGGRWMRAGGEEEGLTGDWHCLL